jgi:hypothetical protein
MSGKPRAVFYIPVQGSSQFAAHADQGSLIRVLWLLSFGKVEPKSIRPLFAKVVARDEWPLLEPGQCSYKIPEAYEERINLTVPNLRRQIARAVDEAVHLRAVGTIVLLYSNHGRGDKLAGRDGVLEPDHFAEWAVNCVDAGKRLLMVLDACSSTDFAREAWKAITSTVAEIRPPEALAFVENNMGFITSGAGLCEQSIAMISEDERLVNLFDKKRDSEKWARGFFIPDSLFFRRFNWLLAYGFPSSAERDSDTDPEAEATDTRSPRLTIKQFVDKMNDLRVHRGFTAAWIGTEQAGASLEFTSLFPFPQLGGLRPADPVPDWPGVRVGDVIPDAAVGELFDDVPQLRARALEDCGGARATLDAEQVLLIPIERDGRGGFVRLPPLVTKDIDQETPFLLRLHSGHSGADDAAAPDAPQRLTVHRLWLKAGRWAAKNKIRSGWAVVTTDICRALEAHIEKNLNVSVPISEWSAVWRLAGFRRLFSSDHIFKLFLEELLRRALCQWPEFRPLYPNVEPLMNDEDLPLVQADLVLVKGRFLIDEIVDDTE